MIRLLARLAPHAPDSFRKTQLERLLALSADAFDIPVPRLPHGPYSVSLRYYGEFLRREAERCISGEQTARRTAGEVEERLFNNACAFGARLRKLLRIRSAEQAVRGLEMLYGLIGIDFHVHADGRFTVSRCFFSGSFSPEVCRVISALDRGVAHGLSGGGALSFERRITEGFPCCEGRFDLEEIR